MNFRRLRLSIGFAAVLAIATAGVGLAQFGANPEAPNPPAATPSPSPNPNATGGPKRGKRAANPNGSPSPGASPSDTPEPPQFTTLDGIWEVELQPLQRRLATYSHLSLTATGSAVTGYYEQGRGKTRSKLTGSFDGRLISLQVVMPDGSTASFTGYTEGFSDMVGIFRTSDTDAGTAFTAQHRKKVKYDGAMIVTADADLRALLERSKSIAVVGASPNPARPSRDVFDNLVRTGRYDVTPINPAVTEISGIAAFPSLEAFAAAHGAPDIVDVFRNAADAPGVTRDAIAAGAKAIWFQFGVVNPDAIAAADAAGLDVVVDLCLKIEIARLLR